MLGDDIAAALPELRAHAESRMTETATVGVYVEGTDVITGDPTRVLQTQRYAGKGRLRWASRDVSAHVGPGQPMSVQEPYWSVPYGTPRLQVDDEVVVTASAADPLLVGRRFRITGAPVAGQVTAHRYPIEEVT